MIKKIIFIVILFSGIFSIQAQSSKTIEQLKKERKEIQRKLELTNKQLKETQRNEKKSINKISTIRQNISERKKLIDNYNGEINLLDNKISKLSAEKLTLEQQLQVLRADYVKMVQKTQVNRNAYSELMFVFSAKDFDQSLRRIRYLKEFNDYQKQQAGKIKNVQYILGQKTDSLGKHKTSKIKVVREKEAETAVLKKNETQEKVMLTDLQKKEKKLQSDYKSSQSKINAINNKIEQIIAEEIRKAEERKRAEAKRKAEEAKRLEAERRKKAEEERQMALAKAKREAERAKEEAKAAGKTKKEIAEVEKKSNAEIAKIENKKIEVAPERTIDYSAPTKEESLLSGNFERNQGRLPWPVDRGAVSARFGVQPHPSLHHVTINNRGTSFQTPAGANARAVYEGIVSRVFSLPGSGYGVIVQHGNYRSVYGNLSNIYVKEGQKVNAKQAIGKIYSDDENGKTELYFQIYAGKQLLNPERWISK